MSNPNPSCVKPSSEATPEQLLYANILEKGAYSGIVIMIVTYLMYIMGVLEPHVPIETVTANWHLGVGEYLKITNSPQGWGWAAMLGTGDFLNFVGLALLALLTIVCYAVLIPGYLRCGDKIYTFLVVAEILVLTLAASGLVGSGGH